MLMKIVATVSTDQWSKLGLYSDAASSSVTSTSMW